MSSMKIGMVTYFGGICRSFMEKHQSIFENKKDRMKTFLEITLLMHSSSVDFTVHSIFFFPGKKYCYGKMEGQYCHCDYCKCKHGYGMEREGILRRNGNREQRYVVPPSPQSRVMEYFFGKFGSVARRPSEREKWIKSATNKNLRQVPEGTVVFFLWTRGFINDTGHAKKKEPITKLH